MWAADFQAAKSGPLGVEPRGPVFACLVISFLGNIPLIFMWRPGQKGARRAKRRPTYFDEMFPPDLNYSDLVGEEIGVDILGNDEIPDTYWADGWLVGFCDAKRVKFDFYDGHWHDAYPTRYRLPDFHLSKSLRRVIAKNADLKTVIRPLRITTGKEELYFQHCMSQFGEVPGEQLSKRYEYITHNASRLTELCVFHPERGLIAFSIFELGAYSTYGNVAAWLPADRDRSLGTFTLLKEVEHAKSIGHVHYYLGHVYLANPSYRYKTRFPGLEIREHDTGIWHKFESERAFDLLAHERPRQMQQ